MVDAEFLLSGTVEDVFDPANRFQLFGNSWDVFGTPDVNVSELVVGYSERSRRSVVEGFPTADFHSCVQESVLAQNSVDVDWSVDVGDGVF